MHDLVRPSVTKRSLLLEVVIVMWVSLGASAVRALLTFAERLISDVPLSGQTATIIAPIVATPWLHFLFQLAGIVLPLGAVALVVYLLHASGESLADIGVDRTQPRRDVLRGAALAAVIGGAGLIFYLIAVQLGINVQIAASTLPGNWYDIHVEWKNIAGDGGIIMRWEKGADIAKAIIPNNRLRTRPIACSSR